MGDEAILWRKYEEEGRFSESKSPILPESPEQNLSEHRWAVLGWDTLETFMELTETDLQRGKVKSAAVRQHSGWQEQWARDGGFEVGDMEDIMDATAVLDEQKPGW